MAELTADLGANGGGQGGRVASSGRELLAHAHELIASAWTQHADARDAGGSPVDPWEADAASWSLMGALVAGYEALLQVRGQSAALEALAGACVRLAHVIDSDSLSDWNDVPDRTQADALMALDAAALGGPPSWLN